MELLTLINKPLQLEPVQHGLAPYLANLDISDAIEGFNKFADMIDLRNSLEQQQQQQQSPWSPSSFSTCASVGASTSQWLSSPPSSSSSSSSFSPSLSSSSSSTSSSSSSSASSSGASSPAPSDRTHYSSATYCSARSSSSSSKRSSSSRYSGRRTKNASAAERYRKRLKGRECGLSEQMDRELERNAKLRRDFESKLALYREFVQLLAFNTSKSDADLAQLGSRSLSIILNSLRDLSSAGDTIDDETRFELEAQQARFQRIINESSSFGTQNQVSMAHQLCLNNSTIMASDLQISAQQ